MRGQSSESVIMQSLPVEKLKTVLYDFSLEPKGGKFDTIVRVFFSYIAFCYNYLPWLKKEMRNGDGWINYRLGFVCKGGEFAQTMEFKNGKIRIIN